MRKHRHGRFLGAPAAETGTAAVTSRDGTDMSCRHRVGCSGCDVIADLCDCPQVPDASFDIVYSLSTYEHLERPWLAAAERPYLETGWAGVVSTCFAWRFHPVPGDYWRFSHMALERIFDDAGLETITSGYDLRARRHDMRGKPPGNADAVPVDDLGGFRENGRHHACRRPAST